MAEHVKGKMGRMEWYSRELLQMAQEVADRLLPAFNTSTGIPFPRVGGWIEGVGWIEWVD